MQRPAGEAKGREAGSGVDGRTLVDGKRTDPTIVSGIKLPYATVWTRSQILLL